MQSNEAGAMAVVQSISRVWLWVIVGCVLLAGVSISAGQKAYAQSNGELHLDKQAGNYHVVVLTSPYPIAVGKIHVLIRIGHETPEGNEEPVRNATVTVRYVPVKVSVALTAHTPVPVNEAAPGTYEADDELESDGQWRAEISINQKDLGATQTSFDFTAVKPLGNELPFGLFFLAALAVGVITTIFFLTRYWSRRQKEADAAETTAEIPAGSTRT